MSGKSYLVNKTDGYDKYLTKHKQALAQTILMAIVLGWVITKEYHPNLRIAYMSLHMARYKVIITIVLCTIYHVHVLCTHTPVHKQHVHHLYMYTWYYVYHNLYVRRRTYPTGSLQISFF